MQTTSERRNDIDWIRVIAIGLLLIYHLTLSFQPWGIFFQFIQSKESIEALWIPMSLINVWRIPILFFVSGMGVFFSMRKRNWKSLLLERSRRILLPLTFGYFFIVPVHVFIFQKYYQGALNYSAGFSHLWFLANIMIYVILLTPLFFLLKRNYKSFIFKNSRKLLAYRAGIYLFIIPFVLEALLVQPESYSLYLFTKHGFFLGLLAFFFGFYFVALGQEFWNTVSKLKWFNLVLALSLFIVRAIAFELKAPAYLMAIESILWIFTVFGLGHSYLNFKNKAISYLSKAAYPVYIIHMIFQYLSNYLIFPLNLNIAVKYLLVMIFTFAGSILFYELIIRRIKFIRPLFGMKY
ncbi:acyltransferase family protein [Roseimarinus sediminis]|uniref:acyltransferase family protein n=1 Tax=Roseimarinus sediminis TaxID=1610899 RepID=UPI003D1A74B5